MSSTRDESWPTTQWITWHSVSAAASGLPLRYVLMLLFIIPIIAMGLLSEEKRRGTMELLLTSPVANGGILLGKFMGAYLFLLVILLPMLPAVTGAVIMFRKVK